MEKKESKELKDKHTDKRLDSDLQKSVERLDKLKNGRNLQDIPLNDEYWLALKYHQRAFNTVE